MSSAASYELILRAFDILKMKGSDVPPVNLILLSGSDSFGENYLLKAKYQGDLSRNVM